MKTIEERMKDIEERMQRQEDIHEIKNLMSRRQWLHAANMHDEVMETMALDTPGVSIEISDSGRWEGSEALKKVHQLHKQGWGDGVGEMAVHTLTTPIIEVAGDGKTAKGVWFSPGIRATRDPVTHNLEAYWAWLKYGCDFVKENGEWKIWHSHAYGIIRNQYHKSWVEHQEENVMPPDAVKPNSPGTPDHPYSTKTAPVNIPEPPEPYETFDDSKSY